MALGTEARPDANIDRGIIKVVFYVLLSSE
jgi:hypothetical protein